MLEEMKKKLPPGANLDQLGGIVRGGETYMIQPGADGKVIVIRMTDAAAVMKEFFAAHMGDFPTPPDEVLEGPNLVERGTMTVNGRVGKAFYDGKDRSRPVTIISTDPDLAELGDAMRRQFGHSMQMMGSVGFPTMGGSMEAVLAQGTPLTFGGADLQTVKHNPIPPERFVLPAEPATLDQVRVLLAPKKIVREAESAKPQP
jgi:hypothetical protein